MTDIKLYNFYAIKYEHLDIRVVYPYSQRRSQIQGEDGGFNTLSFDSITNSWGWLGCKKQKETVNFNNFVKGNEKKMISKLFEAEEWQLRGLLKK